MMNRKPVRFTVRFVVSLLLFSLALSATAKKPVRGKRSSSPFAKIAENYADSLSALSARYAGWHYAGGDTLTNPYYFVLFAAPTLYDAPLKEAMGLSGGTTCNRRRDAAAPTCAAPTCSLETAAPTEMMNSTWCDIYMNSPWLVTTTERQLREADSKRPPTEREMPHGIEPRVSLVEKSKPKADEVSDEVEQGVDDDWRIVVRKPNFWTIKTNASLQLMQNYISDNWYKGGESSNSWLAALNIEATYNNKQKVVFYNYLETKLGFISTHGDDEHNFRSNADLLRMTNKLGLQATKHWYYTLLLQSWTQFYRGYKANDATVYSDFMSPFESVLSLGMDYKLSVKNFSLTATIAPFACDLKYVDRAALATSFGVDEGKHSKFSYGSNLTIKYDWTICKNVTWNGRIYYYTDYSKAQLEWENTFNLTINKFLSTKLFLYPRFDDDVTREEGESYLQFNELLSFGLNITF